MRRCCAIAPTLKTGEEALPRSHRIPVQVCAPPHMAPPQNVTCPRPLGKEQLAPKALNPRHKVGAPHEGWLGGTHLVPWRQKSGES